VGVGADKMYRDCRRRIWRIGNRGGLRGCPVSRMGHLFKVCRGGEGVYSIREHEHWVWRFDLFGDVVWNTVET
jgi:hypothetical protein